MVRLEAQFTAREGMTPDFAAEISNCAGRYRSHVELKLGDRLLRLESLISILSLDMRRGACVAIIAEGEDEQAAAEAMRALLAG